MTEIPVGQDEDALCSVEQVTRLMEDEATDAMLPMIAEGILIASDEARDLGVSTWSFTSAPPAAKRIVAAAVARWIANPEGYITSRAGDETLGWADLGEDAGAIRFTRRETERLRNFAVRLGGFGTFEVTAWNHRSPSGDTIYVDAPRKPFPMWAAE